MEATAALNMVTGGQRTNVRTEWYLQAELDIPGSIDMRKKVQINLV
jgi:hypothetical protein